MADIISADASDDKHYRHAAFTATIINSYASPSSDPQGITWDALLENVISADANADKHYLHDGFSNTITDSYSSPDIAPIGITWDGANVISVGGFALKHYLHSGFSATVSDSYASESSGPTGITWDRANVISADFVEERHYRHSGFSATITDSYEVLGVTTLTGVTWDGNNVMAADATPDRHLLHDGFSATITDSYASPGPVPEGITWTARLPTPKPNAVGVLSFENVTFLNGAFADIRAEDSTGTIQQVVKANRCKFLGGAQGSASYKPQIAIFKGPAHVQFRGCESDLEATVGFGRGGIIGSAIDTSLVASVDGSLIVSDCDFRRIGYLNGADFLSPVMCQAAFGMTVEDSRFRNSHGSVVGWNADARAVSVVDNQMEATSNALGAIYSAQGLNSRRGSSWTVRANKITDNGGDAINLNGSGAAFARNISILKNEMSSISGVAVRANQVGDALIEDNIGFGSTNGVELGAIENTIVVRRNDMRAASLTAYVTGEDTLQAADVTFDRNKGDALDSGGSGLSVDQVRRVDIINNKLVNMADGVSIGEISVEAVFAHNQILDATTPFQTIAGTARASFVAGRNQITDMGNATLIVVLTGVDTITVTANYHTLSAVAARDVTTIDGPLIDGYLLILRLAGALGTITLKDGTGNLNIGSDFVMATLNDQIFLVRDGSNWNQLNRVEVV